MTEVARTNGMSSRIERGDVAEVAVLGNVLRELFNRLGISQNQYAHRVHLDKSAVSRYLGGQRLAPQEFVDRLIREVEEHIGVPLQLEAKEAIRNQRLEALRVCNPAEFQLESLRGELARSRRETDRAHRNIEALHALLEKKESEAGHLADDLTQLRLDWGASQQGLLREIDQLRKDLQDAERLRADAERRSADLRDDVLRLEQELAERGAAEDLPLEALKHELLRMWEEELFPEAAKELTEAASARPLEEVLDLMNWLVEHSPDTMTSETVVTDVARLRPVEDLIRFAPEVNVLAAAEREREQSKSSAVAGAWMTAVASRVTESNVAAFYQGLTRARITRAQGDLILSRAVRRATEPARAIRLIRNALADSTEPSPLAATARAVSVRLRKDETYPFLVALGLLDAGLERVARQIVQHMVFGAGALRTQSTADDRQFHEGIGRLEASDRDVLFAFIADTRNDWLIGRFADRLHHGGDDRRLLHRLMDELASRDALVPLLKRNPDGSSHVSAGLRRYLATQERSARQ
ncbi:helix-turn-helix domain-containing protein [Streptomyces sp. NPDC046324]|uniref:helix-turn-helix domain-containing protein n=1 Tax=Streptomyces sp. NPDC046324 TaxID=3154915 RepID=UPI0033ECCE78